MIYRLYKLDFFDAKDSIILAHCSLQTVFKYMYPLYRMQHTTNGRLTIKRFFKRLNYEIISLTRIFESHFDLISVNSWTSAFITVLYQHQIIL